jgi:hypothetical protein
LNPERLSRWLEEVAAAKARGLKMRRVGDLLLTRGTASGPGADVYLRADGRVAWCVRVREPFPSPHTRQTAAGVCDTLDEALEALEANRAR